MVSQPKSDPARVRVLVVDDSPTVRAVLARRLDSHPGLEVVGNATDGIDALEQIKVLRPDVVTLDVEMPRLDGLGTLRRIMAESPTRVVMVSSLTGEGATATLEALELGAVDFVEKPSSAGLAMARDIADSVGEKVLNAAQARLRTVRAPSARPPTTPLAPAGRRWRAMTVVIGSSTGGPAALNAVITGLPADLGVPVLVVQHMPPGFTRSLAERLDDHSAVTVREAEAGSRPKAGTVLLAPGGYHMRLDATGALAFDEGPPECGVRPAVNITMESVVAAERSRTLGVVLTGMGNDGTRGAGLIKGAGGSVIAEDESTCVVYGMPRSVIEGGYADAVVPLDRMAGEIVKRCVRVPLTAAG